MSRLLSFLTCSTTPSPTFHTNSLNTDYFCANKWLFIPAFYQLAKIMELKFLKAIFSQTLIRASGKLLRLLR